MTRKDSEKDADRPHYYSQFWLDIAAGRRVIGGPKPDEVEANEVEVPEPAPTRKPARSSSADTVKATRASAVIEPEEEELEPENMVADIDLPSIVFDEDAEAAESAEEDFSEDLSETDDDFFAEEEEEEEEDEEWDRRGARKKAKPTRPVKPVKKPKRETRRNF